MRSEVPIQPQEAPMTEWPDTGRVYGLSFASGKHAKQPPELVFLVSREAAADIFSLLSRAAVSEHVGAKDYLRRAFTEHWSDEHVFGYDGAGYIVSVDSGLEYHFPLVSKQTESIVLSIFALTMALESSIAFEEDSEETIPSNIAQLISLTTRCTREGFYGHAVHGKIHTSFRSWLVEFYQKSTEAPHFWTSTKPLPPVVAAAMEEVWQAIAPRELKKYGRESGASVSNDGRFSLTCFGNACDLSIYPDHDWGRGFPSDFSCHNLDSDIQQLTLLSGFAALCDVVSADLG